MRTPLFGRLAVIVVFLSLFLPAGCTVDVRKDDDRRKADVDIRTPLGDMSVRAGANGATTSLPTYPGARLLHERGESKSAQVDIDTSWFGVKVAAAKYESDDPQEKVLQFYREEMKAFGEVTECKGNVDFKGRSGARRPVCREKLFSDEVQLVTGTEERRRVVAVKRRGSGSEFALVQLQMRGDH